MNIAMTFHFDFCNLTSITMSPCYPSVEKTKNPSTCEKKMLGGIIQTPIMWKWTDNPPQNMSLFLKPEFSHECNSTLAWRKVWFLSIEWYKKSWVLLETSPTLGAFHSVAVLMVCIRLTDAYRMGIPYLWYLSIDIHYFLFHVKFEGRLSLSVWGKRQLVTKSWSWGDRQVSKKSQLFSNSDTFAYSCVSKFKTPSWALGCGFFSPPPITSLLHSSSLFTFFTGWYQILLYIYRLTLSIDGCKVTLPSSAC